MGEAKEESEPGPEGHQGEQGNDRSAKPELRVEVPLPPEGNRRVQREKRELAKINGLRCVDDAGTSEEQR